MRRRLEEAEEALRALRTGEVDAVLVESDHEQVYTLETADKPYRLLVEQMPQGAATLTVDGTILYCNRRFADLLKRPLQALLGKPIHDFIASESWPYFEALLRRGLGAEVQDEFTLQCADGAAMPVYLGISALQEGALGLCLMVTDLTEQKHYRELQRSQEALRRSEERFRVLAEAGPQMIWSSDAEGLIQYINNYWSEYTGLTLEQTRDPKHVQRIVHPDDYQPMMDLWAVANATGGTFEAEFRLRRASDGAYRWFLSRSVPVRDEQGRVVQRLGANTDIDDRKRAEEALRESEQQFRGTFENAAVGIAHKDGEGRYLRVNQKYCEIVGYSREELLVTTFRDITHPDDLAAELKQYVLLMRGELSHYSLEKRYIRKDGSLIWVDLAISLQRNTAGQPMYAIAILQDISERKRLEGELRQAKEAAEAANRSKSEFLANVSHEIRTPMNAILGMTELVLDTPLAEDQQECLQTVQSAADNLLGILNDLLDFSKIEAGKLELDRTDFSLRAVLGESLRALAVRAHKKKLELAYHVPPDAPDALVGDARRLRQILLNLVGNAIKFTEHGEVVIRVEVAGDLAPDGRVGLRFSVRDTGIGIPLEKQEQIFHPFEQEDTSTTRTYGGTGLGLTIAARLVVLMGGTITVQSEPGRGSTFAFVARFGRQPPGSEPTAAPLPILLRDLPVLIVDDNATNCQILLEWLRGWQMEPAAVGDGAAAMDALWHGITSGRPYALVLLDAAMPGTSGLALAARIRQRAELSATHIILLTSGDPADDRARSRELNIDAYLLKPVLQAELLATIYKAMSRTGGGALPMPELAAAPSPNAAPLRILVAEDNEFNMRHLERLLVRRGHSVHLAINGREALTLLGLEGQGSGAGRPRSEGRGEESLAGMTPDSPSPITNFDVLLLDLHMPEFDGFQVVRAIREWEQAAGGHLPVVALTARSRDEDRKRCLAAGMDAYLSKPVRAAELFAALDPVRPAHEVSRPAQPADGGRTSLLDPVTLLATCGDDADGLRELCQDLRTYAPARLAEVVDALRAQDGPRLREAAHKLCGLLSAFSRVAGDLAAEVEDNAALSQLDEARPLVGRLETMVDELVRQVDDLSYERLRRQAGTADSRERTTGA